MANSGRWLGPPSEHEDTVWLHPLLATKEYENWIYVTKTDHPMLNSSKIFQIFKNNLPLIIQTCLVGITMWTCMSTESITSFESAKTLPMCTSQYTCRYHYLGIFAMGSLRIQQVLHLLKHLRINFVWLTFLTFIKLLLIPIIRISNAY